jgi:hypothetical protein
MPVTERDDRPGRFKRKGFPPPEREITEEEAARLEVKQKAIASGKFDVDPGDDDLPGRWARAQPK